MINIVAEKKSRQKQNVAFSLWSLVQNFIMLIRKK